MEDEVEDCPQSCDCHPRLPIGRGCGMCFCGGRTPESNKEGWKKALAEGLRGVRKVVRHNRAVEARLRREAGRK